MVWAKGQSGNIHGRPRRGQSFADALRAALREKDEETKQTALRRVADAAVQKAIDGDMTAVEFIANRLDGKVPDQLATQGEMLIRVVYDDDGGADHLVAEGASGAAAGDPGSEEV